MELPSKVKQKPILFVNTESFLNEENLKKMETFSESQGEVQRTCLYIQGSVHQNHIDAPFVLKVCNFSLSKLKFPKKSLSVQMFVCVSRPEETH